MEKIAIKSNDIDLSKQVIEKLENIGHIEVGKMKPEQLTYMVYVFDQDMIVSPLCLEMHYPEYKTIYATDYLKEDSTV